MKSRTSLQVFSDISLELISLGLNSQAHDFLNICIAPLGELYSDEPGYSAERGEEEELVERLAESLWTMDRIRMWAENHYPDLTPLLGNLEVTLWGSKIAEHFGNSRSQRQDRIKTLRAGFREVVAGTGSRNGDSSPRYPWC